MKVVDGQDKWRHDGYKYRTRWDFGRLIDDFDLKVGLELGVEYGYFSRHLLATSKLDKLYSVDKYSSSRKQLQTEWKRRTAVCVLGEFGERSELVVLESEAASVNVKRHQLDFLYLDAMHRYRPFVRDLALWWDKVKPGGIISGHDWMREEEGDKGTEGVRQGVIDWCNSLRRGPEITVSLTVEPHASWWFVVPK